MDKELTKQDHFSVLLLSFAEEWHEDVWNVLAVETLAGDLYGYFGNKIALDTFRINNSDDIFKVIEKTAENKYDLICCSLDIGSQYLFFKLLQNLRSLFTSYPIVCGGTLATYAGDYLTESEDFMYFHPLIVLDDGELVLREIIIRQINKETNEKPIFNTMYFDSDENKYKKSKGEKTNLDKLIYPPQHFMYKKNTVHILQASRKCVFNCAYCTQGPSNKWQSLPINRIKQNIEDLIEIGINEFEFVDDEYFGGISSYHINRAHEIANIFKEAKEKYKIDIKFRIFTNPYIICRNKEYIKVLECLKNLGLSRVYLGIESGSKNQRKRYNRIDSLENCREAIDILEHLQIIVDAGFIMFDPEMNAEELLENIAFIKEINILKYNTWPFRSITITAQTPLYFRILKLGLLGERSKANPASFTYNFQDPTIKQINFAIEKVAFNTSKIFYILKYFYKEHCYSQNDNLQKVSYYLVKNANINLQYIQNMANEIKTKNCIKESTYFMGNDMLKLIIEIRDNIHIFNSFEYSPEYLLKSIDEAIKSHNFNIEEIFSYK